jgi:hypothetical protein
VTRRLRFEFFPVGYHVVAEPGRGSRTAVGTEVAEAEVKEPAAPADG